MPSPGFLFVDGLHADRAAKKRLRQHVMRGKNAGKKINRQSQTSKALVLKSPEPRARFQLKPFSLVAHLNRFGGTLSSLPFPIEVTADNLQVIDTCAYYSMLQKSQPANDSQSVYACVAERVYPTNVQLSVRDVRAVWLELLFYDAGSEFN